MAVARKGPADGSGSRTTGENETPAKGGTDDVAAGNQPSTRRGAENGLPPPDLAGHWLFCGTRRTAAYDRGGWRGQEGC